MPSNGIDDSHGLWRDPESATPREKCAPEVSLTTPKGDRIPSALLFFTIPNFRTGDREAIVPDCKSGVHVCGFRRFESFSVHYKFYQGSMR